jgi:hypothetical protein
LRAEKGHFAFNAYMLSLATTSSPSTCASMFNYLPGLNYSIILYYILNNLAQLKRVFPRNF